MSSGACGSGPLNRTVPRLAGLISENVTEKPGSGRILHRGPNTTGANPIWISGSPVGLLRNRMCGTPFVGGSSLAAV
jgi:hypothetical protein